MVLGLKGIPFQIEYVDLNKNAKYKKLPVLEPGDREPIDNYEAIEDYIENNFPEPDLKIAEYSKADKAGQDLYSKFAKFMRNSNPKLDAKLRGDLNRELLKLNEFLENESLGAYLDGEKLKLPDCNLLPKLMHVKEAGELKGFTISQEYEGVLEYLKQATRQKVFRDTFTDQVKEDIKSGWWKKMGN